tara:strand:- start:124 stop:240 length:117 start_codon:yes stop_codon:yes gene_type:complete
MVYALDNINMFVDNRISDVGAIVKRRNFKILTSVMVDI